MLLARLSSPLALLTSGVRDLPMRQQTIRATITWSYDLLRKDEQTLFRRLGVFVGGCTLEAVEAICVDEKMGDATEQAMAARSTMLEQVAALVDKSLLRQIETPLGEVSFTMFETIREYALEQLTVNGELEQMRRRHLAYFLEYGECQAARPDGAST
jgi:predicted ATPase